MIWMYYIDIPCQFGKYTNNWGFPPYSYSVILLPLLLFQKSTQKSTNIQIGIGWKEYDRKQRCYKQVRSQSGGGTLYEPVNRNIEYQTLLELAKNKFFPKGKSVNGINMLERDFFLGNNQGLNFELEDHFVLDELGPKVKVYLYSRQVWFTFKSF